MSEITYLGKKLDGAKILLEAGKSHVLVFEIYNQYPQPVNIIDFTVKSEDTKLIEYPTILMPKERKNIKLEISPPSERREAYKPEFSFTEYYD